MAKQIADEEDRLKRQARRRLIGAVALTTAVVVILPLVLDSEPRPPGEGIELRIPDKDNAEHFNPKIDVPHASAVAVTEPAPASVVVAAAPAASAVPVPVAPVPAAAPVTVAVAPAPLETKPAAPQAKPAAPEPAKQAAKTEPAKQAAKPSGKKEAAKKESAAKTEQGHAAPTSGFIVQIGAFNNPNTAHSWMSNLKTQGFKAYTEKVGEKIRVRVGPYSTREAANAARKKIEKTQGLHSNIVELN